MGVAARFGLLLVGLAILVALIIEAVTMALPYFMKPYMAWRARQIETWRRMKEQYYNNKDPVQPEIYTRHDKR